MADYAVRRIDDMEAIVQGSFKKARAELGITSFGIQVIDFPPNVDGYPEHDHARDGGGVTGPWSRDGHGRRWSLA